MRSTMPLAACCAAMLALSWGPIALARQVTIVSEAPAVQAEAVQLVLHSELMGRDYQIEVTAPFRGPVFPGQKAAVVYALDGGWGVAGPAGWLLGGGGAMSPAYIITIGYPQGQPNSREQDLLPRPARRQDGTMAQGGRSPLFTRFLTEELRPFIEARYPVDPMRSVLFGHSLGGVFTANVLAKQPAAFSGYLIASPSVWADPTVTNRLRNATTGLDRAVFVAYGECEDDYMVQGGRDLSEALQGRDHARTEVFPGAYHITYYPAVMGAAMPFLLPRQVPLTFPVAIELSRSQLAAYTGRYLTSGAIPIDFDAKDGGLIAFIPGGDRLPLQPNSKTKFFAPELDVHVDFAHDGQSLMLFVNGDRIDATRAR